jgi:lipid-binding SYLF domain-containing protein
MERRSIVIGLALSIGTLAAGCAGPSTPSEQAAKRREIDASVDSALTQLYAKTPGARELVAKSRGQLVFPNVIAAGFVVGAQGGDGALRSGGRTVGYYRTASGSFGLQAGAESKAIFILFMTQDSYNQFVQSNGWTVGADASVTLIQVGAAGTIDSNTVNAPVIGLVQTNAGLMANLSLAGTKVTKLDV